MKADRYRLEESIYDRTTGKVIFRNSDGWYDIPYMKIHRLTPRNDKLEEIKQMIMPKFRKNIPVANRRVVFGPKMLMITNHIAEKHKIARYLGRVEYGLEADIHTKFIEVQKQRHPYTKYANPLLK